MAIRQIIISCSLGGNLRNGVGVMSKTLLKKSQFNYIIQMENGDFILCNFAKGLSSFYMSPNHQRYMQWNGDRFRKWAEKIGANTQTVISAILGGYKVEQQGYKALWGC